MSAASPPADFANKVRTEALKRGLILLTCGVYGNVIRFLSPITIQDEVFTEALGKLELDPGSTRRLVRCLEFLIGRHQAADFFYGCYLQARRPTICILLNEYILRQTECRS